MKNSLINKTIYEIQEIKQNKKNEDINDNEKEVVGDLFDFLEGFLLLDFVEILEGHL